MFKEQQGESSRRSRQGGDGRPGAVAFARCATGSQWRVVSSAGRRAVRIRE